MRKLILILLAIAMIATNPSKENYINHVKSDIGIESGLVSFLANPLIDRTTTETNLLIGTVYRTRFGDREQVTLGVGGRFIPLFPPPSHP